MLDVQQIRARPWVLFGCGYTGTRLARRLRDHGAAVWATRRAADDADALAAKLSVSARGAQKSDLDLRDWLPHSAVIVDMAPPDGSDGQSERNLVEAAAAAQAARIVYVSSTGVYPPGNGSWIHEDSPVGPASRHGRARLAAETALLDQARLLGVPAVSLRAVGIYGPGRGVAARLVAGTYRIIGAGDTYVNRIHVDDLGSAILAAALVPDLPHTIYNIADDLPDTSRAHADQTADILGVTRAPSVPESEVDPGVVAMLRANRRVSNARMKSELGVRLAYPTWHEGLRQIMAEDGLSPASNRQ